MKITTYEHLEEIRARGLETLYPARAKISVGMATCGLATGAQQVYDALNKTISEKKLALLLTKTGCLGFCQKEPIVDLLIPGMPRLTYMEITPEKAIKIVEAIDRGEIYKNDLLCKFEEEELLIQGEMRKFPLFLDTNDLKDVALYQDVPFFAKQKKIVLRNCGFINPESIEEYIARGGYQALYKVLMTFSPEDVIEEMKRSGLRGRGGAGFPTGRKWEFCRMAEGEPKYIICNADEGDPGAYMDRSVMEGDPHAILEGMLIGAYAIGANQGYIYIRMEYPLAIKAIECALKQAREYGLLGTNIFGSDFSFDLEIKHGAGAFVCGEETSLMASIEGRPAEPRQRPPFPAQSGLWGKPTNINNVETWANVAVVMARGADYFSQIGRGSNSGTKVFSLVGQIRNSGLVEVPMGISLNEIIYDIGGGISRGKRFKAVQTGGPSGGCIPSSLINLPVDYEKLKEIGSIMGSGGMVVMDEDTCVVDIARFFLAFTRDESCGNCTSCREGSDVLLDMLTQISEGKGEEGDLTLLEELCQAIKKASLCALGQTLPNPVLSTLQHYRDEYEAHITYKRCPAVVCKQIISSPCQYICPLDQDASCYIGLIAQRKFREAFEIVRKENPLPAICGRVCHAPCESKCRSGEDGEPIAIRSLKRFLTDYAKKHGLYTEIVPKQQREKKVAVVGSGPAGLACAHYLALEGYNITIFESLPVAGGMLAVGIPEYRLPREELEFEIELLIKSGVEIKTNTALGRDILLEDLKKAYNTIFLATGAHKGLKMGIPGEETENVKDAVEFLRQINLGHQVDLGDRVIVVGGGNAAIDTARVARRLGKAVKILYRRTKEEMPAIKSEVEEALHEGIEMQFLAAPVNIITNNGRIETIECLKMRPGDIDASGRRRPIPVEGSEFHVEADTLILAIGQQPDTSFLNSGAKTQLTVSKWETLEVDPETLQTAEEGIFAGGDVISGPATVTEAIGHGKLAAQMITKYLQGQAVERTYTVTRPAIRVEAVELSEEELESLRRPQMPVLSPAERLNSFKEVELGFTETQAIQEARRCLRCDLEIE